MIKYDFFDPAVDPNASTNVDHVLAFFEWIQEVDTNGFPPEPDIITDQARQAAQIAANTGGVDPMAGAPDYFKTVCTGCHAVGGQGGNVGPALDAVATKYERDYLLRWISDPQTVKPGTTMPALGLDPETLEQIVTYLETLK
jgi:nitric oxide reductase subunit C